MNPFYAYVEQWKDRIEDALDRALPLEDDPPEVVNRAMRYTVFAGGKRVRPNLVLLGARAAGGAEEEALPFAAAVEMVHAFSLIHDDLPAMDDDDLRRGKPSCHKAFGEGIAILAGDGLLSEAFGVLAKAGRADSISEAVRVLSRAVGSAGLVGGQVEDLLAEGREPDLATVERIHLGKTAALFVACARLGVISAGGGREVDERLGRYGRAVGLAFQIVDDVLDETGGDAEFGKTSGRDREVRKMTYPAAVGLDRARERAAELTKEARDAVAGLPGEEILGSLASMVLTRTH